MKVRLAIPSKGRLHQLSLANLEKAGIRLVDRAERVLIARTVDPEIDVIFARAFDIPKFVEQGAADLGITGYDFVVEREADVVETADLKFGESRLVLAVPEASGIARPQDLKGMRVATKFVNIAKRYFARMGINADIIRVTGAAEITPYLGVADAIIDVVSTGESLAAHKLQAVDVILQSSARLIANRSSLVRKKSKIDEIRLAFESVLAAREKKLVMMNVPERRLQGVIRVLPAMAGPTLAKIESPEPMWEVYSVVDEKEVYRVVNEAKKAGARDIIVLPIERVVR